MLKRFEVIDLFHDTEEFRQSEPEEWITDSLPKEKSGLYKVKTDNGSLSTAYYCEDRCSELMKGRAMIDQKRLDPVVILSHWYDQFTYKPLQVISWGKGIKQKEKIC